MRPTAVPRRATADRCGRIPNAKRHARLRIPGETGCNTDNASSLQFLPYVMSENSSGSSRYKHAMKAEQHA